MPNRFGYATNVSDIPNKVELKGLKQFSNYKEKPTSKSPAPVHVTMSYDDSITAHNKQAGSIKEKEHAKIADVMKNNGKGLVTPEEAYNRRAKMKQGEVIRKGFIKSLKIAEHKADLRKIKNAKKF